MRPRLDLSFSRPKIGAMNMNGHEGRVVAGMHSRGENGQANRLCVCHKGPSTSGRECGEYTAEQCYPSNRHTIA